MRLLLAFCAFCLVHAADLIPPGTGFGELGQPGVYAPKDGVVDIDISEYAGYGGLIVANGGLTAGEGSFLSTRHGLRLRLRLSESENWKQLNAGEFAASVTTADVLALLGPRMKTVVPVLLSYSRGADALVAGSGVRTVNDLKGKAVVCAQFNESEFLLRYLAQEGNLPVHAPATPDAPLRADALNLLFAEDGFAAGDLFLARLKAGDQRVAGCLTWSPKTGEVVQASAGKARVLASNRNLLVIADVLLVNAGFAQAQPQLVRALVHGVLEGNRLLRSDPARHLPVVAKAFGWDEAKARAELAKVHLANRAENLAFFDGSMDAAGSFAYILQCANLVYEGYGAGAVDPAQLADLAHLKALAGDFPGETVAIRPAAALDAAAGATLEPTTVVKRDVRFLFEPNSAKLDLGDKANLENLTRLANWLRASPGSVLLMVGHVEPSLRDSFRQRMGAPAADAMAEKLGRERAAAVRQALIDRHKADADRLVPQSRGWLEPIPGETDLARNRRVEVQWQMLE